MSVQITKSVLKEFLGNAETDVLALTGSWGTGKTHAWNEALMAHKARIKFKQYCYVSLFGIKSMAELRMSLFTKSVSVSMLGQNPDLATVNQHWGAITKDGLRALYGRFGPMIRSLPHGASLSLGLESLAPSMVRNTLICFDDFERQTTINAEDVLGLITELREERGCKVALIFNAEKLIAKEAYRSYREKAIDFEVLYAPTVQEAFELVFDVTFQNRDLVLNHVVNLEITNVRILRKLQQILERIMSVIGTSHLEIIAKSISTTVLLCWCAYAPDTSKPKIEDIDNWNSFLLSFKKESDQDALALAWAQRLKAYGFIYVSDLDLTLARVVENGYVEGTGFVEIVCKLEQDRRNEEMSKRFVAIWRQFHHSFSDDEVSFIAELHEATLYAIAHISSTDLNGTVGLLRELHRDDLADSLINKFIETNISKPSAFDLKKHPFGGQSTM